MSSALCRRRPCPEVVPWISYFELSTILEILPHLRTLLKPSAGSLERSRKYQNWSRGTVCPIPFELSLLLRHGELKLHPVDAVDAVNEQDEDEDERDLPDVSTLTSDVCILAIQCIPSFHIEAWQPMGCGR